MSKQDYIDKIVEQLNKCNDIPLIDLILTILHKSI